MRNYVWTTLLTLTVLGASPQVTSAEGLLSNVSKGLGEVVEETVEAVEQTTPDVTVDLGITSVSTEQSVEVNAPLVDASVSSEEGIFVDTIVEADVTKEEGISIKAPIAEVNVTPEAKVEVKTPIAKANVSPTDGIEVTSPVVNTELSTNEISVSTPVVEVRTPSAEVTPTTPVEIEESQPEETPPPVAEEQVQLPPTTAQEREELTFIEAPTELERTPVTTAVPVQETMEIVPSVSLAEEPVVQQEVSLIDLPVYEWFTPIQGETTTSTNASSNSFTSGLSNPVGSGGSAVSAVLVIPDWYETERATRFAGHVKLLYDQWMNAPPSQPPQSTSFFHTFG